MALEDLNTLGFSPDIKVVAGKEIDDESEYLCVCVFV